MRCGTCLRPMRLDNCAEPPCGGGEMIVVGPAGIPVVPVALGDVMVWGCVLRYTMGEYLRCIGEEMVAAAAVVPGAAPLPGNPVPPGAAAAAGFPAPMVLLPTCMRGEDGPEVGVSWWGMETMLVGPLPLGPAPQPPLAMFGCTGMWWMCVLALEYFICTRGCSGDMMCCCLMGDWYLTFAGRGGAAAAAAAATGESSNPGWSSNREKPFPPAP